MKRVATALVLIPLIVYAVMWGPWWLVYGLAVIVALLCFHEYSHIAGLGPRYGAGPFGYAAGLVLLTIGPRHSLAVLALSTIFAMILALRSTDLADALPRASLLVAGLIYVFGCWKFALLLWDANPVWLLYALALTWVGDIGAYYVGKAFGRHRLAPRISPGKSWEGAAASVVASVLFGYPLLTIMLAVSPAAAVLLTIGANIAGQLGDLAESAMKRGAGVKDSGTLLPGHGGMLDRVDSTLFVLPVVYVFFYWRAGL